MTLSFTPPWRSRRTLRRMSSTRHTKQTVSSSVFFLFLCLLDVTLPVYCTHHLRTSPMSSGTHSLSIGMWYQPNAFFFYSQLVSLMKPNHVLVWLWDFQLTFKQTVPLFFWLEEHSGHILWRCRVNVMLSRSRSCRQLTPESLPPFCVPPTQCIPPFVQNSSFIPPFLPVFLLFLLLCHAISPLPPSLPLTSSSLCNVLLFLKESPHSLCFSHSFYNFSSLSFYALI